MKQVCIKIILLVLPLAIMSIYLCIFNTKTVYAAETFPDYALNFIKTGAESNIRKLNGLNADLTGRALHLTADGGDTPSAVLYLPANDITDEQYRYISVRFKMQNGSAKMAVSFYDSNNRNKLLNASSISEISDTDEWQTAVFDAKSENDISGNYANALTLSFSDMATAEWNIDINSIAFFSSKNAALNFTGFEIPEDIIAAQQGKWRSEEFVIPGAAYRMTKLLYEFPAKYENLIDSLCNSYGYGGIVTNVAFNDRYLKDEKQFELVKNGFAYALSHGMSQAWLYDEYQWPSGSAFGQTTEGHPEYESIGIKELISSGTGDISYTLPDEYERAAYAFAESDGQNRTPVNVEGRVISQPWEGKYTLYVYAIKKTFVDPGPSAYNFERNPYINIMSAGPVKRFIELTHERYKQYLGDTFSNIEAFFTDEPSLKTSIFDGGDATYMLPWEDTLPDVFMQMHGYSVLDHMDSLFSGDTDEDKAVRANFYDTVGAMIAENYFGQLEAWCSANGKALSGHILLEERLSMHVGYYGNAFACLKRMGIPGCDILHVTPDDLLNSSTYIGNYLGCKFASSASRITGKTDTFIEFNPSDRNNKVFFNDTLNQTLGGLSLCTFFGVNRIDMLNPFEDYSESESTMLNEYAGRINTILDGAQMCSGIGLFYPISTMQGLFTAENTNSLKTTDSVSSLDNYYQGLALALLKAQLDYNILDEESIINAELNDGALNVAGTEYKLIIMPMTEIISLEAMQKLNSFADQGGKIIWIGSVPSICTDFSATAELKNIASAYSASVIKADSASYDNVISEIRKCYDYNFTLKDDITGTLFVSPYKTDDKSLVYIVNSGTENSKFKFAFKNGAPFSVYDPETGHITDYEGEAEIACKSYRGIIIVADADKDNLINFNNTTSAAAGRGKILPIVISAAALLCVGAGIASFAVIRRKKKNVKKEI